MPVSSPAAAQRTAANTEAKLLMMTHAFDVWGVRRLDLKTDERNDRSRRAIERIGGQFEGVLRNWQAAQVDGEDERVLRTGSGQGPQGGRTGGRQRLRRGG